MRLGSLPGKRESRRFGGNHILRQHEVRDSGNFDDIIAYGGWNMDDYHPAGLYYPDFSSGISRPISDLARAAKLCGIGETARLFDGLDRDREAESHAWEAPLGGAVEYRWNEPVNIGGARLTFDSNLNNGKMMPCSYPQKGGPHRLPSSLVKSFRVEICDSNGQWSVAFETTLNIQRLVKIGFEQSNGPAISAHRKLARGGRACFRLRAAGKERDANTSHADGPGVAGCRGAHSRRRFGGARKRSETRKDTIHAA